jgi:opacity protein-like surface antigen
MKKSLGILGAVLAFGMLSAPAFAGPTLYVSGNLGGSSFNDIKSTDSVTTIATTSGINVTGAVGVKCCVTHIRLEGEVGYQKNNADTIKNGSGVYGLTGNYSVTSYMANAYYDLNAIVLSPYITAGIGVAEVGVNNVVNPLFTANEKHSVLGYQFGAGVAIPVTKFIDFDVRYRYYGTGTVTLSNNNGELKLPGNSFLVGLRIGI